MLVPQDLDVTALLDTDARVILASETRIVVAVTIERRLLRHFLPFLAAMIDLAQEGESAENPASRE